MVHKDENKTNNKKMCSDFFFSFFCKIGTIMRERAKKKNHVSGASSGPTVGVNVKLEPPVKHAPGSSLLFLLREADTSASRAGEGKGPLNSKPSTFFFLSRRPAEEKK